MIYVFILCHQTFWQRNRHCLDWMIRKDIHDVRSVIILKLDGVK